MTGPLHPEAPIPTEPGTWGWWPVIAARVRDARAGDRVSFPDHEGDDALPFIVAETGVSDSGIRQRFLTITGEQFFIGLLYRGSVLIDRPSYHGTLADSCR